jgi:hypothetical protein
VVDFSKLVRSSKKTDYSDLLSLFDSLDQQASHTELRPAQKEACQILSTRRNEKDLILKLSTGAGKTTIGLLYLKSYMDENTESVAYLCPTIQLVNQVLKESERLGIAAHAYPSGQSQPHIDCTRGSAITVCTYAKLFNAKSTFNRMDVSLTPCAIVLDDAHAGVEEIRSAFTAQIKEQKIYSSLIGMLNGGCSSYKPSLWKSVTDCDPTAAYEVPYWIWAPLVKDIDKFLSENSESNDLKFVWPFLSDHLRWCKCVIGSSTIEIRPEVPPVEQIRAYSNAKHRLFMSATLADDAILVREVSCLKEAAKKPICPTNDRGLGERMVLAPSLFDDKLDRQWVMSICSKLSLKLNVIVLCHSEKKANDWKAFGASVFLGEQVEQAIEVLKNEPQIGHLFVFVQRYDGVDLPDKMCRILVIDGMPLGESVGDRLDSSKTFSPGGQRNRIIYRIEQGMGRAVRSHADYAVVILVGTDLVNFVAKKEVLSSMTIETQAQLNLALDLAKIGLQEGSDNPDQVVVDMLSKCMKRDEAWKQYYNETVRKSTRHSMPTSDDKLQLAEAERNAFRSAIANDIVNAKSKLEIAVDSTQIDGDEKGVYLQKIANYTYDLDQGKAFEIQRSAYQKQNNLFCPPNIKQRPKEVANTEQSLKIFEWYSSFQNPNGTLAFISELRSRLSFNGSTNTFEQAFADLSLPLGATGSRPENEDGIGPDCLWLWNDSALIIEAKTQNVDSLHKKDAAQLLHSIEWYRQYFSKPTSLTPIIVSSVTIVDSDTVFPKGTRLLTPELLDSFLTALDRFYTRLIHEPPLFRQPTALNNPLEELSLTA